MILYYIFLVSQIKYDAALYPGASALIVNEFVEVDIDHDFRLTENRELEYFIFNTLGREKYGEVFQQYNSRFDTLQILKAQTVLSNGDVLIPEKTAVSDLSTEESFLAPAYEFMRTRTISYPGVSAGTTIEYASKKTSGAISRDRTISGIIPFQKMDPILHKKLILKLPKNADIKYRVTGGIKSVRKEESDRIIYNWSLDSVPRMIDEPFMIPLKESAPKVMFSNFKNWQEVGQWLYKKIKGSIRYDADMIQTTTTIERQIVEGISPEVAKYTFLSEMYKQLAIGWREIPLSLQEQGFTPLYSHLVFKNRYGSDLDKASLLIALFTIPGYTAYPVYVSFSDVRDSLPMPEYFNTILVAVADHDSFIFFDPRFTFDTENVFPYNPVPGFNSLALVTGFPRALSLKPDVIGRPAAIATKDSLIFTTIPDVEDPVSSVKMNVEISLDGSISGQVKVVLRGMAAARCRKYFRYTREKESKAGVELITDMLKIKTKVKKHELTNIGDPLMPVEIYVEFESPDYIARQDSNYKFEIPRPLFSFFELEGIFSLNSRENAFTVQNKRTMEYELKVKYPRSYDIIFHPDSIDIRNSEGFATSRFASTDSSFEVSRSFGFARSEYMPEEYAKLLSLYQAFGSIAQQNVLFKTK